MTSEKTKHVQTLMLDFFSASSRFKSLTLKNPLSLSFKDAEALSDDLHSAHKEMTEIKGLLNAFGVFVTLPGEP